MKCVTHKMVLSFLLMLVLMLYHTDIFAQCAMCKNVVESNNLESNPASFGKGLNRGILYLMGLPYLLVGVMGYMIYRNRKKKKDLTQTL